MENILLEGVSIADTLASLKKWFERKLERAKEVRLDMKSKLVGAFRKVSRKDMKDKVVNQDVTAKVDGKEVKVASKGDSMEKFYDKCKSIIESLFNGFKRVIDVIIRLCQDALKALGVETQKEREERARREAMEAEERAAEREAYIREMQRRIRADERKEKISHAFNGLMSVGEAVSDVMRLLVNYKRFAQEFGFIEDSNIETFMESTDNVILVKLTKYANNAQSFITKRIRKIEKGISAVNKKLQNNPTYKAVDDLSLQAIEFLRVPMQICKAGNNFQYIQSSLSNWTDPVLKGLNQQGNALVNEANKGVQAAKSGNQEQATQSLSLCSKIVSGIGSAMAAIGSTFNSIWATIKGAMGLKQEDYYDVNEFEGFVSLDEEIDILIDDLY